MINQILSLKQYIDQNYTTEEHFCHNNKIPFSTFKNWGKANHQVQIIDNKVHVIKTIRILTDESMGAEL